MSIIRPDQLAVLQRLYEVSQNSAVLEPGKETLRGLWGTGKSAKKLIVGFRAAWRDSGMRPNTV